MLRLPWLTSKTNLNINTGHKNVFQNVNIFIEFGANENICVFQNVKIFIEFGANENICVFQNVKIFIESGTNENI